MTIAACYLLPEGVVFGSDSTWTIPVKGFDPEQPDEHYFNHGQKLFEVGQNSTLGILIWGLNSFPEVSFRTLVATFADQLNANPAPSVQEIANRWSAFFWERYSAIYAEKKARLAELSELLGGQEEADEEEEVVGGNQEDAQEANDQADEEEPSEEERELEFLKEEYKGGFCVGGYCPPDRTPGAYEIMYNLNMDAPQVASLEIGVPRFWGWGNLIDRLLFGMDRRLMGAICDSDHWDGNLGDLVKLIKEECLIQPTIVPIREAVDWIHASVYTTIKSMKFSHLAPVCGGPIDLAVITTDRMFRWVRHKDLDSALVND